MEDKQREEFAHLVERVGMPVDEAERVLRDGDLWVAPPEMRLDVPDEEAIEEWTTAYYVLGDLMHVADRIGLGTMAAIGDAQARVQIALERTKERVRRAREQE